MNRIIIALVFIFILSCNEENKKIENQNKGIVLDKDLKVIPDSCVSRIQDTGFIKIGYNSKLTTKLFEYIYINDITFNGGKLKIGLSLKDALQNYPNYKFKKLRIKDYEAKDGFWEQESYFISDKSYFFAGTLAIEENSKILSIVSKDTFLKLDKINIKVGDNIIVICDYFNISCKELKKRFDTLTKEWQTSSIGEQYIDIELYQTKDKKSDYFLRYVWDIETRKIIRIEVKYNDF